jgi:acyl-CoA synthetase (AMP-forming)/AMP-acid ligase II
MRRHKRPPPEVAVSANVAIEVLNSLAVRGRHAFTYVDSLGVIERLTVVAAAREAQQWASELKKRGVQPGDRVIVLAERDRRWPCALLGVLEAGGVAGVGAG